MIHQKYKIKRTDLFWWLLYVWLQICVWLMYEEDFYSIQVTVE
jgi:hypothetical protein